MSTFYNEIDPYAAQWIRNLEAAGHIAPGRVDERSIADLKPDDLVGFAQCHFFAGIGVWSHALRLAGWPDDAPVWTGSCPCQPFSSAGLGGGFDDARHLWPKWFPLIRERRPSVVLGEQVANLRGLRWLDLVSADLEAEGYAFGAADLCAASVGAPHVRQRLFWVAVAEGARLEGRSYGERGVAAQPVRLLSAGSGQQHPWSDTVWLDCVDGRRPTQPGLLPLAHGVAERVGRLRAYGNAIVPQVAVAFIRAAFPSLSPHHPGTTP